LILRETSGYDFLSGVGISMAKAIKIPSKVFYRNTLIRVLLFRANDLFFGATNVGQRVCSNSTQSTLANFETERFRSLEIDTQLDWLVKRDISPD
jgi:hypothetical protein